ncbi:MAG: TrkH family potassium uptake protein [Clostridia bacterium]|nr:TrkH family potassium uptake protein [Clostridia bacterium]
MNYKMIGYTLGQVLIFEALFLAVPAITAICYFEWTALLSALGTAALCVLCGFILSRLKPQNKKLLAKDGLVIVSLSWIVMSLFGALPFVFSGSIPNYIDALFETVSGFTTTGSSILSGNQLTNMPHAMVIWRSFTNWVGGMGVLVFVMAILPLSGAENMHIMKAESPGPTVSKLVPRVRKTAIILYFIYFVMTMILFITLLFDNVVGSDAKYKMGVFEALCTAFSTAGTGGFGVKPDSILSFSPFVQIVCTVGMFLFSINFNTYYLILRLKFREAFNSEVRIFLIIVATAIVTVSLNIFLTQSVGGASLGEAIRHAAFTVVSIISTTGFATVDFNAWPILALTVITILMFIGGCAGSTAGGIKVSRIVILIKGMFRELSSQIRPNQVKRINIDGRPVEREVIRTVNAYIITFVLIFASSIILLSFDPYEYILQDGSKLVTNFTAVTTTLNNVGPGLDMVGPTQNFAFFSPLSKLVLIFDMLAGRLELFPMLILFAPVTWKKT